MAQSYKQQTAELEKESVTTRGGELEQGLAVGRGRGELGMPEARKGRTGMVADILFPPLIRTHHTLSPLRGLGSQIQLRTMA